MFLTRHCQLIDGFTQRDEYAGRISDARSFHGISQDIVSRWLYPLVPDSRIVNGDGVSHLQQVNHSFQAADAAVSRSAVLGDGVVIGSGTVVGERAVLVNTVVGENCRIAADAVVTGSHIHNCKFLCFLYYGSLALSPRSQT